MRFTYPWLNPRLKGTKKAGLISLGSVDEKIPLILFTLLLSTDITLAFYQNYPFSPSRSIALLEEIKSFILNIEARSIVFDLRVQDWTGFQNLRQSRKLARHLQDICSFRHISSSVFMSSGSQQLGHFVGLPFEILEAREVFEGKGSPDLVKFALEMGSDFLLLSKKVQHRMEANILLKEKIMSGEVSSLAAKILKTPFSPLDASKKIGIFAPKEGFLHHWIPEELLILKHKFFSFLPGSGISLLRKQGDMLKKGDEIAEVYFLEGQQKFWSDDDFKRGFFISSDPPDFRPFILERLEMKFL